MFGENENSISRKAYELDALFCNHASVEKINQFFCKNQESLINIFQKMKCSDILFTIDFIAVIDNRYVKDICLHILHRNQHEYYIKILNSVSMVRSNKLDPMKKALFWNLLSKLTITSYSEYIPSEFLSMDIFSDTIYAFYPKLFRDKLGKKYEFIKKRMLDSNNFFLNCFTPKEEIKEAIDNDHVSIFEMDRQLRGKNITTSMLRYLLCHNAVKCFTHLLVCYPKSVYKCRTPEEWLFTVCRCCSAKLAIPIIKLIEEDYPGIVERACDPWGNTLLWNSLVNHNDSVEEIQNILIEFGCDPNKKINGGFLSGLFRKTN